MNMKHIVTGMFVAACLMAAAPTVSADSSACNNYGIGVAFWVGNGNCQVKQCYMGTGAAAGAGAAGAGGTEDTGAEARAGGECDNSSGEPGSGCAGTVGAEPPNKLDFSDDVDDVPVLGSPETTSVLQFTGSC